MVAENVLKRSGAPRRRILLHCAGGERFRAALCSGCSPLNFETTPTPIEVERPRARLWQAIRPRHRRWFRRERSLMLWKGALRYNC